MTAAFLQTELASLIQDSKRKQSDVRTAAEKSLSDLKSISVTSETQLAGDLLRRPQFIDPFVLACNSKYPKLAITGTVCLQRLVASQAIPRGRLADVLDAFQEASHQGLDVQLKILQALPSLLQLYAAELQGDPLAKILSLCANLAGSKTGLVSSTAIATFQQLVSTVFERKLRDEGASENAQDGDNAVEDASRIFSDMCAVVNHEQTQFLRLQGLAPSLALEVIETSLSNDELGLMGLPSCGIACEAHLLPGLTEILQKSNNFALIGRTLRISYLLVTWHLDRLYSSLSDILGIIMTILDRPTGPSWKRVVCLEFMKSICSDFSTLQNVYRSFDKGSQPKPLVSGLMAILVRIASEDPSLIGLGRQSTLPTNSAGEDDTALAGAADVDIGAVGSVMQANASVTGISTKFSTPSNPLLDQIDRTTAPDLPATYIYTLVLACVAAFTDGLSKFVMPFSVPTRGSVKMAGVEDVDGESDTFEKTNGQPQRSQKYQRLINPLTREDLSDISSVQLCASMIEDCWPGVLATCSTFLSSALDSYYYHILVRTVQKLAQVSGVMELFTPRDALLTSLAKVSVPINASTLVSMVHGSKSAKRADAEHDLDPELESIKSPVLSTPRHSIDVSRQSLNVRNLLCLRALLNLGIALGPTLSESAWFIIIQSLQQAEALMSVSPTARAATTNASAAQNTDSDALTGLGSEITAVATASKRMLESTKTYSDTSFTTITRSIFKMIDDLRPTLVEDTLASDHHQNKLRPPVSPRTPRSHRPTRSISGVVSTSSVLQVEAEFVLKTISDLARVNLPRFTVPTLRQTSWDLVTARLLQIVQNKDVESSLRVQAASIIDTIAIETIRQVEKQELSSEDVDELQQICLGFLATQIASLYKNNRGNQEISLTDIEIHRRVLETLENIISHSGDSLKRGWRILFEILEVTVSKENTGTESTQESLDQADIEGRTIPPAFRTVQLIVSDFLDTIDPYSFLVLVRLLPLFGKQTVDLNIPLTTTALFWNVMSLLLDRCDSLPKPEHSNLQILLQDGPAQLDVDISSLWFYTGKCLGQLCEDSRTEVRNSALRVMMRIFDASSEYLTSEMWNLSLQDLVLPLLEMYAVNENQQAEWHMSFSQLLAGVVAIFSHNAGMITKTGKFSETWAEIIQTFRTMLSQGTISGHAVVFKSATELLRILKDTPTTSNDVVTPILHLWLDFHPSQIPYEEESNQAALLFHAQLFTVLHESDVEAVENHSQGGQKLADYVKVNISRTIFDCIHPAYTTDVNKLSTEQDTVIAMLAILKKTMNTPRSAYSSFLLELVRRGLSRHGVDSDVQKQPVGRKGVQIPTLVAFISRCVSLLRCTIEEEATRDGYMVGLEVPDAILVLTDAIRTKYTDIPVSTDLPLWQNATIAVVELLEVLCTNSNKVEGQELGKISPYIVDASTAILNAPALETQVKKPAEEVVLKDEEFDILQFRRLHKAIMPLLQLSIFPETDRRDYAIVLFRASLVAEPWYGDFPTDLATNPLSNFKTIRSGSIKPSVFPMRKVIGYQALEALVAMVAQNPEASFNGTDPSMPSSPLKSTLSNRASSSLVPAKSAAPYVLLRIAHTIKTFLADQRLRYLNPPPRPLQKELNVILSKALELKSQNAAFDALFPTTMLKISQVSVDNEANGDGKSHLRILYFLILQLEDFWAQYLPRLKVCAWQEDKDGLAIEKALNSWGKLIAEDWAF